MRTLVYLLGGAMFVAACAKVESGFELDPVMPDPPPRVIIVDMQSVSDLAEPQEPVVDLRATDLRTPNNDLRTPTEDLRSTDLRQ
jgi:hypothetical protein